MYKLKAIVLVFALLFLLVPLNEIDLGWPASSSNNSDLSSKEADLSLYSIVSIGNKSFIYLGMGLYYPIDSIPWLRTSNGSHKVAMLNASLMKNHVKLIVKYDDVYEKIAILSEVHKVGGAVAYEYKAFPLLSVSIPLENVTKLAFTFSALRATISLMPDYLVKVRLSESVPIVKPPLKWAEVERKYGAKVNGSGVIIGILDTGIDASHPDFYFPNGTSKIVYSVSFVPGEDAADGFGHGTHVAGIAAGTGLASGGKYVGVAPGAKLANIKVLANNGTGYVSWVLKGIEFAINKSIDVVNLSLGGGPSGAGDDPLSVALDVASKKGIVAVVSAGNEGPYYYSVSSPGIARSVITVGAVYKNLTLAEFSSGGPTGDLRIKPDVLAPGVDVVAPLAKGSFLEKLFKERYPGDVVRGRGGDYVPLSGTSMSAPHVSGVAALLLQLRRDYTPEMVKAAIVSTAVDLGYDLCKQGHGLVNAYNAAVAPVIPLNASVALGLVTDGALSYYTFVETAGSKHSISIKRAFFGPLGGNASYSFSEYVSLIGLRDKIDPRSNLTVTIKLIKPLPFGVFVGFVDFLIDGTYVMRTSFSAGRMVTIVSNITVEHRYLDGVFVLYDRSRPSEVVLPAGYKYDYDGLFSYKVWFFVKPGTYALFATSYEYVAGRRMYVEPLFVGTKEVRATELDRVIHVKFTDDEAARYEIPRRADGDVPYFSIVMVKTPANATFAVFRGGLINTSSSYLLLSLNSGDEVYLNFQYVNVPRYFSSNVLEGVRYTSEYATLSWVFKSNPSYIPIGRLYEYRVVTNSTLDEDIGHFSLAVFPPHMDYTYVYPLPFCQGCDYRIHVPTPLYDEHIGAVALGLSWLKFRSIAFLDPTKDEVNAVRLVSPPFMPFVYVREGFKADVGSYINVTSALLTTYAPLNVIAEGSSCTRVYFEDVLIFKEEEEGDFNMQHLGYSPLKRGRYVVESTHKLSYPLYTTVELRAYFDTRHDDFRPPMPYEFDIPVVLSTSNLLTFRFVDSGSTLAVQIYVSWDGGATWSSASYALSSYRLAGGYYLHVIDVSLPYRASKLSIKLYVADPSGNYYQATIYNASHYVRGYYDGRAYLKVSPSYAKPDQPLSLSIASTISVAYGLSIYVDGKLFLNVPLNKTEAIDLRNVLSHPYYGAYLISAAVKFNVLKEPVYLDETFLITELRIEGVYLDGVGLDVSKANATRRVDVGREVGVRVQVVWAHNGSLALNAIVKINGTKYRVQEEGIVLRDRLNTVGCREYVVEEAYYEDPAANVKLEARLPNLRTIKVIWDLISVKAEQLKEELLEGEEAAIVFYAYHSFDLKPLRGALYVELFKLEDGRWLYVGSEEVKGEGQFKYSLKMPSGRYLVSVKSIFDEEYGVGAFSPLNLTVAFEKALVNVSYSKGLLVNYVTVSLKYPTTGKPISNAYVTVGNVRANEVQPGVYLAELPISLYPTSYRVLIQFDSYERSAEVAAWNYEITVSIVALAVASLYLLKRRVRRAR